MTRNPQTFGRKPPPLSPRRTGHESISFFAGLGALVCAAWAVSSGQALAYLLTVCLFIFGALIRGEEA